RRDFGWILVSSFLLFVGGNGLINVAEQTLESGVAAVLTSTTPLWLALMQLAWPGGERLSARGWAGPLARLARVLLLLSPRLQGPIRLLDDPGPFLVLGSACCWALGSLVVRHRRVGRSHLAAAAYQMAVGGTSLALLGLALGEGSDVTPERLTARA